MSYEEPVSPWFSYEEEEDTCHMRSQYHLGFHIPWFSYEEEEDTCHMRSQYHLGFPSTARLYFNLTTTNLVQLTTTTLVQLSTTTLYLPLVSTSISVVGVHTHACTRVTLTNLNPKPSTLFHCRRAHTHVHTRHTHKSSIIYTCSLCMCSMCSFPFPL
jgi:hypothetical protein